MSRGFDRLGGVNGHHKISAFEPAPSSAQRAQSDGPAGGRCRQE